MAESRITLTLSKDNLADRRASTEGYGGISHSGQSFDCIIIKATDEWPLFFC